MASLQVPSVNRSASGTSGATKAVILVSRDVRISCYQWTDRHFPRRSEDLHEALASDHCRLTYRNHSFQLAANPLLSTASWQ